MSLAFPELGKHCSKASCHQHTFLPYRCDLCRDHYCEDHYQPQEHDCRNIASIKTNVALVCATCNKPYSELLGHKCGGNQSARKRPKCAFPSCREHGLVVQMSMTTCDECHATFCLKHRFHAQLHAAAPAVSAPIAAKVAPVASAASPTAAVAATSCAETERDMRLQAALRRQGQQQQQQPQPQKVK